MVGGIAGLDAINAAIAGAYKDASISDGGLEQDRVADGGAPELGAGLGVHADDLAGSGADEELAVDDGRRREGGIDERALNRPAW